MVYCGKPSKACLPCRKRKLLCDLGRPGCSQCRRARLECTGYRDTNAIRFRDETMAIQRRLSRAINPALTPLNLSVSDQAKEIFYKDFVTDKPAGYGFLRNYYSLPNGEDPFSKSLEAVSLAYLHAQKPNETARSESRQKYITALNTTNNAVHDPDLALQDSTILSVMLLDLYEKITNTTPQFQSPWAAHIKGALSLAKLRGDEMYRDAQSLAILARLTANMFITCAASDTPVPEEVISIKLNSFTAVVDHSSPKYNMPDLLLRNTRLRCQATHNSIDDSDAVHEARILDIQFANLAQRMQTARQHTVFVEEPSPHHYEPYHIVYDNQYERDVEHGFRRTRILLCDIILEKSAGASTDPAFGPDQAREALRYASETVHQMSREICATIPPCFVQSSGMTEANVSKHDSSSSNKRTSTDAMRRSAEVDKSHDTHASRFLCAYRLIFPLYVVANSPAASHSTKEYVVQQLRFMADSFGIANALAVAKFIEDGIKLTPWAVYALLGSYGFLG